MDSVKHSVLNIGTLGHIDHGKTSLTRAITNVFTDRHSESIKRNMTIKLGYADAVIKKCEECEGAS
ncbi:MAG: GTP-binding protein, partial [Candidatus Micrarchaeaceae archaeon]